MLYSIPLQRKALYLYLLLQTLCTQSGAQETQYKQFWGELELSSPARHKIAYQVTLSGSFSNTPDKKSMFSTYTQFSSLFAIHYYYSAKTNFSFYTTYLTNKYVPEIGQREYPEIRFSAQAIYFLKKIGYILQSRTRLEYRLIQNNDQKFEDVFRLRERIKYTKAIKRSYIREKTYYLIVSDEVFIKSPSNITGKQVFDRNEASIGLGYAFTLNVSAELYYINQFIPRTTGNEIIHAVQLSLIINNPIISIRDKISKRKAQLL